MATNRSWEENQRDREDRDRVRRLIDQVRQDLTSWHMAERLNEPAEVCEQWVNRIWNELREGLDPEERLLAIIDLIEDDCQHQAEHMLRDGLA